MWLIKSSVCLLVGGGDLTRHLHVFKSTGWHHCHFHRLLCNKLEWYDFWCQLTHIILEYRLSNEGVCVINIK